MMGAIGIENRGWGAPDELVGGLLAAAGLSGTTLYFQVFYRVNPATSCNGSSEITTNAILVTVIP